MRPLPATQTANLWMTSQRKQGDTALSARATSATQRHTGAGTAITKNRKGSPADHRKDALLIPLAFASLSFLIFLLTRAGFHTFDGIAYVRDMGKPLSALVLPHHLIYEPTVLGFYKIWQAFGWTGEADAPAQVLSSLAGAGGLALFYKLTWMWTSSRPAALLSTLALAFSYGYWFYSVEVDIYLPPLFFLLLAAWLFTRVVKASGGPVLMYYLIGLAHAFAILIHQAALFIVPAFLLGLWLIPRENRERLLHVVRYGLGLAGVVIPIYLFAGTVIAGQSTPDSFLKWVNSYGNLGTWGVVSAETPANALSGMSAAISAEFWTGRVLVITIISMALLLSRRSIQRGGAFAWTLCAWTITYLAFFTWWQPEVLKFWVLVLPAPLLLVTMSIDWTHLQSRSRNVALGASIAILAALLLTNAPEIWAKRDPLSDPARQVSAVLAQLTDQEDLIVLQAGAAESYLPFYYNRINVMSTRELWYLLGGVGGRNAAIANIKERAWHALAKGSSVWLEDRVLTPGTQSGDHYVFTPEELKTLLNLYGVPLTPEKVSAGPETFYRLTPQSSYGKNTDWQFTADHAGWSGVNVSGDTFQEAGWCFALQNDPNLYGPPMQLDVSSFKRLEISMKSSIGGVAQLFYRASPDAPYSEENSLQFSIEPGEQTYSIALGGAPGWSGTIEGLRFDPLEQGIPSSAENRVCVKEVRLVP